MLELPYQPGWQEDDIAPLSNCQRINDRCILAKPTTNWEDACKTLSTLAGGQWRPKAFGLTWSYSKSVLWIVEPDRLTEINAARALASPWCHDPGWSVGSIGRTLLKAIGEGQRADNVDRFLWEDASIGLRVCRPGRHANGVAYDASAYYYNMMCKLPSLTCLPMADGRIHWMHEGRADARTRREIQEAIGSHKGLRNAVWGCMVGSTKPSPYYFKGERRPGVALLGPFRPAGQVLARAAYELTLMAAREVESVYTHTDCVTSTGGLYPSVWESNGFPIKVSYDGPIVINNMCSFRIGSHTSHYYQEDDLLQVLLDIPDQPRLSYGRGWAYAA